MPRRTLIALVVIAAVVAGLGVLRSRERAADAGPDAAQPSAAAEHDVARPALLDFGRGTCVPCQKMMPVLDELARRHEGAVDVRYMDLADAASRERAEQLGVRVIPTQVLLAADGTELGRHEGFWPLEEIEARFEELGWTRPR